MPRAGWNIVERRGEGALRSLRSDWERLYAAMPLRASYHAYQAHLAYLSNLSPAPERLRCLALSDGERIRAICPLEARTERVMGVPLRIWALPLHPHWPLTDVIAPEDDAREHLIPSLAEHLRQVPDGGSLLVLGPLPRSSRLWRGLDHLHRHEYHVRPTRPADVFDCTKPYDELMSRLSKHFRRNLRAAGRKLSQLAEVRRVTARDVPDLVGEFAAFLDVEASGWKGPCGTGSAIALHPELRCFYRDLVEALGTSGQCEINTLYADGGCRAAQFCVTTGTEYDVLKIGYDEAYGRVAPGLMLLQETLERCCADPDIKRLSLVTDGPWQRDWHPDVVPMCQAYIGIGRLSPQLSIELARFRYGYGPKVAHGLRNGYDALLHGVRRQEHR